MRSPTLTRAAGPCRPTDLAVADGETSPWFGLIRDVVGYDDGRGLEIFARRVTTTRCQGTDLDLESLW